MSYYFLKDWHLGLPLLDMYVAVRKRLPLCLYVLSTLLSTIIKGFSPHAHGVF